MTEVYALIAVAILALILLCLLWVKLIKARENRLVKKEKEFKESTNYDNRRN